MVRSLLAVFCLVALLTTIVGCGSGASGGTVKLRPTDIKASQHRKDDKG